MTPPALACCPEVALASHLACGLSLHPARWLEAG
jgi:hypothetical protein